MMRKLRSFAAVWLLCVTPAAYPTYASPCVVTAGDGIAQTSRSTTKREAAHDITSRPLEVGKPIERQIGGGQTHCFSIRLEAGQLLDATVEQKDVDVAVVLLGPSGETVLEVDSPNGTNGPEPVVFVADAAGEYTLEVKTLDPADKGGRYEARVDEVRVATEKDRQLAEATRLSGQSVLLAGAGKGREALEVSERAVAMYEKALGPEHPGTASALDNLASLYYSLGQYSKAEPLWVRARAIREKALGAEHPDTAQSLHSLAVLYYSLGQYAEAEPLYVRALAIREKALGPEHPDTAQALNNLALLYYAQGQYAKAEPLFVRALAIRENSLGPEDRSTADSLISLAGLYLSQGQYAKAEPLFVRALAIYEKALGPEHPDTAASLINLAGLYLRQGQYAKAEPLFVRALTIYERALGPEHPDTAASLINLAGLYLRQGQYAKAEPLFVRALAIREKALGPEHRSTADSLNNLAAIYYEQGQYAKAEPLLERALAIREKALGAEHPDTAQSLNNLAALYVSQGQYTKAVQVFVRALAIDEKAFGPEHPETALSLSNLAGLYVSQGQYAKAEPLLERALAIDEKALGPEHPSTASSLNNLALLYWKLGQYAKAEPLWVRVLAIREKALGTEHSYTASSLDNLALLYYAQGQYMKAEPLWVRALAIREKALGPEHPDTANTLNSLAGLYAAREDYPAAIRFQARANEASERDLLRNLASGSEREKLLYLQLTSLNLDQTLSLHLQRAPSEATASRLALEIILRRKGRALDAMTGAIALLRRRASPEDAALLDQLTQARAELSRRTLAGPGREGVVAHRAELARLEMQVEALEGDVASRSAEFRAVSVPITIEGVQLQVPTGALLVEYASYFPYDAKTRKSGERRYAVYTLGHTGEPRWADLGEAKPIDEAITALRAVLRNPKSNVRKDVRPKARQVDELVMRPVRKLVGDARRLFVAPDGALNLVPFDALVDERGKYLVASYEISYLTSGRDLLRIRERIESRHRSEIIANPDFGPIAASNDDRRRIEHDAGEPSQETAASLLARAFFPPLGATEGEARAIEAMLPGANVLTGAAATKSALKELSAPRILHIATHGFFFDSQITAPSETRGLGLSGGSEGPAPDVGGPRLENPLLRSGLVLAGANLHRADGDGILTALEVAGLDLWGTKLVVLSACDTGVGEITAGDGVYGLRRALVLAGSETQVMSLWPVSDAGTRDLMVAYYKRLSGGEGRSSAMRAVRLEMLKDSERHHPFFWASFIVSGAWANLDWKR